AAFLLSTGLAIATEPAPLSSGLGPAISGPIDPAIHRTALPARNWIDQTQATADAKSAGCLQCHQGVEPMHSSPAVVLGCTDCHGGNPARGLTKEQAHIHPLNPESWRSSANPPNSTILLNNESPEF